MVSIRRWAAVLLAASALAATIAASPTTTVAAQPTSTDSTPAGWRLVWADEFNGTQIDRSKWNVLNKSTYGDGNKELACLMDRPENVKVANGTLRLTARKETKPFLCGKNDTRFPNGRTYTSAHLHTRHKAGFTYGRIEMRATLPTSQGNSKGLWPALWMRPTNGGTGELDIMEALGSDGSTLEWRQVHQTIHYDYVKTHPKQGNAYTFPSGVTPSDGMHVYAVEWEPTEIRWYVDGTLVYTRNQSTTPWLSTTFNKEFFIRLNLAVGGNWPGSPQGTTFPATFEVDYVRVYQR